jgi:MYXO-CTERM domain-containing protein
MHNDELTDAYFELLAEPTLIMVLLLALVAALAALRRRART